MAKYIAPSLPITTSVSGSGLPETNSSSFARIARALRLQMDGVHRAVGPVEAKMAR